MSLATTGLGHWVEIEERCLGAAGQHGCGLCSENRRRSLGCSREESRQGVHSQNRTAPREEFACDSAEWGATEGFGVSSWPGLALLQVFTTTWVSEIVLPVAVSAGGGWGKGVSPLVRAEAAGRGAGCFHRCPL